MDEAFHHSQLKAHCRVCGSSTHRHKSTQECSKYASGLKAAYGIDVSVDSKSIHPNRFCTPCYAAMKRILKTSGRIRSSVRVFKWEGHKDDCKVRQKFINNNSVNHKYTILYRSVNTS